MPKDANPDGRANNKRPPKWGEPKTRVVNWKLTPVAHDWIMALGGVDWIEQQARNL